MNITIKNLVKNIHIYNDNDVEDMRTKVTTALLEAINSVQLMNGDKEQFKSLESDIQNQQKTAFCNTLNTQKKPLKPQRLQEPEQENYIEMKKEEKASFARFVRAETELLGVALDYLRSLPNSEKNHSLVYGTGKARELESFLPQVYSFQMLVEQQILPLLENLENNKK